MAEINTEERMGHLRTTVQLEPGEKVLLCRCFLSKTFPLCDVTHKHHDIQAGPVLVECKSANQAELPQS